MQETQVAEPFYVSEIAYYSNNPQWSSLSKDILPKVSRFVIRIWDASCKPIKMVLSEVIFLESLMYIQSNEYAFPTNSVVFHFVDGCYVREQVRRELIESRQLLPLNMRKVYKQTQSTPAKLSLSVSLLKRTLEKKQNILRKQLELSQLVGAIKDKIVEREHVFQLTQQRISLEEKN